MEVVSGESNWRLTAVREGAGTVILRAAACGERAVLPERLLGAPVVALGSHALAPGDRSWPAGEEVLVTCGAPEGEWDNQQVRELTLPASLERVGDYALLNCRGLRVLRLHDGVRHWGGGALMNCRELDTFHLRRTGGDQGPSLAYLVGELSRELDVTIEAPGGTARLLFPEFTELYEENCPAHHFDYNISGAGYPYHHCFREKKLRLSEYDALFPGFLGMEHETGTALRLAWLRLRYPVELGERAGERYLDFLRAHGAEALEMVAGAGDGPGLELLLEQVRPEREALASACEAARKRGDAAVLARLLEESHRRFPAGAGKRFLL